MTEEPANQTTLGHDVFVSYASQDAAVANSIVENLEQHGLKCWIAPRDVKPGAQYADEIVGAINDAKVFVLVLSENALVSPHVGRELERAASKRRRIVVLRTDAAPLTRSFEYFLSESQWIDVAALGVPAALMKLTQAVGQGLSPASWVSPGLGTDVRDPADQKHKPSYLTIKRMVASAVLLVVAALVVGVMVRYGPSKHGGPQVPAVAAISDKSIAVLPFADMSEKRDQEYFADGMAEEIIDLLARIPGLKVIARTSSFQFKGHNEDLRTIGAKLGVAYVLEGSVRKSGDRARVTAQLIDVSDGSHRWSGSYDRDLVDVLKVQDEISLGLVRALQISMGADQPESRPILKSVEGYGLYLKGLQAYNRYDKQGFDQAANYFRQAMQLDPESARAPALLAVVYLSQAFYGFMRPDTAYEEARRYAEHARSLDPRSEVALALLGLVQIFHDWDWVAGAAELDRALALAPGNAAILAFHSYGTCVFGQWDTTIRDLNAAVALDPLFPGAYGLLGLNHLGAGRWSEAESAFKRALGIAPTSALLHHYLAKALLYKGEKQAALREIDLEQSEWEKLIGRAAINHALGRKAESEAALDRFMKNYPDRAYGVAQIHASRGESDAAFLWLERAFIQKDSFLWSIKSEPYLNSLKGDPRYKAFLRKMNLPND
jgi:TolB-like protein/Tfp pilus assembly protein PilF